MEDQKTFLFLGDSITDAYHNLNVDQDGLGNGYVRRIAERLWTQSEKDQVRIINRGHDGFTVQGVLRMVNMDCIPWKPDVVSILIGCNDVEVARNRKSNLKEQRFAHNYDRLLKQITENTEAKIICMGAFIFPKPQENLLLIPEILEAERIERESAAKHGASFLPLHDRLNQAAREVGMDHITTDGTHLAPAGAQILADAWMRLI